VAFLAVAEVLDGGARKYGPDNWRRIDVREHLNHCITHLFAYLAGDGSDDHLEHAACRAMMALEIKRVGMDKPKETGFHPGGLAACMQKQMGCLDLAGDAGLMDGDEWKLCEGAYEARCANCCGERVCRLTRRSLSAPADYRCAPCIKGCGYYVA
jgi:hypothetical protein